MVCVCVCVCMCVCVSFVFCLRVFRFKKCRAIGILLGIKFGNRHKTRQSALLSFFFFIAREMPRYNGHSAIFPEISCYFITSDVVFS